MYLLTNPTAYVISGRVKVKYLKLPTILLYSVGFTDFLFESTLNSTPVSAGMSRSSGVRSDDHKGLGEETCGICSEELVTRLGQATFTAECSCSFHMNCISTRLNSGNQFCPTCNSIWTSIPSTNGTRSHPYPRYSPYPQPTPSSKTRSHPPASSLLWPEPPYGHQFCDDEPLPKSGEVSAEPSKNSLPSLILKSFPELPALAASDSVSKLAALVGVQAPSLMDDSRRAPIDLVAVLDVSGSMWGAKMALLKRAVEFVIQNLGPSDRLAIVAFSTSAQRVFPLRLMNERGREDATIAIKSLSAEGATDIVQGIKKGVRVLQERREMNTVASIMFLSDGMDTYGRKHNNIKRFLPASICPEQGNCEAVAAAPIIVHSFGFGLDHDAAILHTISDASGGTFSFIESIEIVQDAFAKCIGGLLSVVAQEVRLSMRTLSPGVHIGSIPSGRYFNSIYCQGREGVIDIGDMYADEEKDFLVYLSVPPSPDSEGSHERKTLLMDVMCSFRESMSNQLVQVQGERVEIRRPEILSATDLIVRLEVDRQRNRLAVAEGIAEAQAMADRGDLTGAQAVLKNRKSTLLSSASAQAGDRLCSWLESELNEIEERMASLELYEQAGRAYSYAGLSSHSRQRSTTVGIRSTASGSHRVMRLQASSIGSPQGMALNSCDLGGANMGYDTPAMAKMMSKSKSFRTANPLPLPHTPGDAQPR
ncbi:hypothetical protein RJ640_000549 [Escallonia rubra]|uniref:Uncharacterized protein n=1 Tax=Escallonia rubra TaxID=112253 RepID=A0AA88S119_9ASTE|nr:hypothetical protein RJ640_000549 [Escallonia rubra]